MKILFISREKKTLSIDSVFEGLKQHCDLTVIKFSPEQVKKIRKSFKEINYNDYDCVVINVPFRRWYNKPRLIKKIPNLAVFDYDTYRNFLKGEEFYKKYSKFYKKVKGIRLICSGYYNAQRYKEQGIDACFISKGYDDKNLRNLGLDRDIPLGFIGRINDDLYQDRKIYLSDIRDNFGLQLLRTECKEEYLNTLNRIKIFVSADIGYNEYMAKNFEAMACGCALVAKRQGNGEEEALGLIDMQNVVLYDDLSEAHEKINLLLKDSDLTEKIGSNGQKLVEGSFGLTNKGGELYRLLQEKFG
ncbi:MAG: hypothetical protein D6B27_11135 [Gammaproteobacteria bacterium]|nr:MAG: hypothetical protein D6B27_11135 [Gammaproteobacteria bacterium]